MVDVAEEKLWSVRAATDEAEHQPKSLPSMDVEIDDIITSSFSYSLNVSESLLIQSVGRVNIGEGDEWEPNACQMRGLDRAKPITR